VIVAVKMGLLVKHPLLLSTSLEVSLPSGDADRSEDLGDDAVAWLPSLVVEVALGDAEGVIKVGGEFGEHVSACIVESTIAYAFGNVVPSIGLEAALAGDEKEVSLVPAIGFPIIQNMELVFEAPFGVTSGALNWGIGAELKVEFSCAFCGSPG
jgi:hypothetical protein